MRAKVIVLTTGGTISHRSKASGAAAMGFDPQELASRIGLPHVDLEFRKVMQKGSKDIVPDDWTKIAAAVVEAMAAKPSGVVILHGTDTMHYTASALSFALLDLSAPVIMTGSMIAGGDANSDSLPNFRDAVQVAVDADFAEVCIVFSADAPRTKALIVRGCRARKVRSYAIDAFVSLNAQPIGHIEGGRIARTALAVRKRGKSQPKLNAEFDPNVVLIKCNPALTAITMSRQLNGASGAVLEGTGIGHIPTSLRGVVAAFNGPAVISTQTLYGGERLGLYETDREILEIPNIIPVGDMNSDTALVKLMWALKNGDVRSFMQSNVAGEIDESSVGAFMRRDANHQR
jgi:glutamyl-tRNA(Gln) amidotransferase subunit D